MASPPASPVAPALRSTAQPGEPQEALPENYRSPLTLVVLGLILMVIACALAAAFNVFFESPDIQQYFDNNRAARILTLYALYGIPTVLVAFSLVMMLAGAVRWAIYGRSGELFAARLEYRGVLESMNERLLLSDTAKRIAFRHEDIALVRQTIRDDIDKHDFDAALVLVQEIGQTYGYVEEAEAFRDEIIEIRQHETDAKIDQAIKRLDAMVARQDFDAALKDANKLKRMYPDSHRVRELPQKVTTSREQYKQALMREFLESVKRDDVDGAWALLGKLDRYLTEREAEPLRETARGVIGKHRDNLGVQFQMAVHDKEWVMAVRVGQELIRQFPNSRMADEVRSRLDRLRELAAGQSAAVSPSNATTAEPTRDPDTRTRASDEADENAPAAS